MLQRVKTYWLKGVLEESLHGAELIDLSLAYRPSAVAGADTPWQETAEYDIPLPLGTPISTVFHAAGGELLILGEPGAGKTTMLLQLVSDLLAEAERDEQRPMPIVFSLASWLNEKPLAEWLADELSSNYEVPRRLGLAWLAERRFIPLLDGLDEVDQAHRDACTEAINHFRQAHGGVSLLVTARSQDYQVLAQRLHLEKAIVLQPLSLEQTDAYLAGRGARFAGLRAALHTDAGLRELAQTPLMLSIMTLAYYRMPADIAVSLGNRRAGRQLLFDVYVERMVRYRSGEKEYAPDDAVRWLAWLAQAMAQQNRRIFFLETLQPNWLPRPRQRRFADGIKFTITLLCLLVGALAGALGVPAYGWVALPVGAGVGALLGLLPLLTGRLLVRSRANWYKIETVEALGWSWPWAWLALAVGGVGGGLLGALLTSVVNTAVPWWLLLPLFFSAALVLEFALVRSEVKLRTTPGRGIEHSQRNGVRVGVVTAVATAVLSLLVLSAAALLDVAVPWPAMVPWVVGVALYLSVVGGLAYGGLAALKHRRLRAILQRDGVVPADYARFLDYAAERNLLRKVGGGYTFVHALLLDYFRRLAKAEEA